MSKVFCFGEILLRMSLSENWRHDSIIKSYVGGAEANVAFALSAWNIPVKYCSAFPENFVAEKIIAYLEEKNIDTSASIRSGNRIGLYYLQQGSDLKSAGTTYDRAHSSFAELQPNTIDWNEKLKEVSHVHLTAISPAVSQSAADVCGELLKAAKQKNITVSLDLNYREKLWKYGKEPIDVMPALANYADIIMGNIWAANKMLGIELSNNISNFSLQNDFLQEAEKSSKLIMSQFPACKTVVNTFRFNQENETVRYFATVCNKKEFVHSKEKIYDNIVDKAGTGDCFMAGVIYGLYKKKSLQQTVDFATGAAIGKLYEIGDHTNQRVEDIERRINKIE
ncbi:carbohydrate kinase [Arachidicoccus ginsenosidimutans]|uniref:sugar kinase n=1 Tax=Arachidicoccus sp. BS20 TaxID=1850526 RepID=UPI0007F12B08|nr:sugar kinase [Arachidicoccus sp. BS20]ANI88392.1 carbohydrate kinase [Arachidicoccus sp. BS20]